MPHTFVHLRLDPERTAFWLPEYGQRAAAKIPVKSFWALRVNWDGDEDDNAPGFIFVISSKPSPFPLVNSSLTLGPKVADDTDVFWEEPTALRTEQYIVTDDEHAPQPLYLHTTPTLPINIYCRPPIHWFHYRLNKWSLKCFLRTVHEVLPLARDFRKQEKLSRARSGGLERVEEGWSPYDGGEAYIIGGRNDPKTFVFKFLGGPFPSLEGPPTIYEEIRLYKQVCKDYKWAGAKRTIDLVNNIRKHRPRTSQEGFSTSGAAYSHLSQSPDVTDPLWRADALLLLSKRYPPLDPESVDLNSDTGEEFVRHAFPRLPFHYPPMTSPGRIRIVVFDLFGVILDREGAIKEALTSWTLVDGCTTDVIQLAKLYLEYEARINYYCTAQPVSLPRIVHTALSELSEKLDLHISPLSSLFTDTMARILGPSPFPDVEPAITALADCGVKLVCFPPHSDTTMRHYERALPAAFRDHPLELVPDIGPQEILILSGGMGRLLITAIEYEFYATALLKRANSIEGNVDFVVGELPGHVPTPSMTVGGLVELVAVLKSL